MKKLVCTSALALLFANAAFAADLPSRKAPEILPPAAPLWTGFYAGLNAGGAWASNNSVNVSTWPLQPGSYVNTAAPLNGTVSSGSNGGFIGGGQVGYNFQANYGGRSFVTGVEADFQGLTSGGGSGNSLFSVLPLAGGGVNGTVTSAVGANASLSWLGTVRGRIGWLATPTLLLFGSGGVAYGGVNLNVNTFQNANATIQRIPFTSNGFGSSNVSSTPLGWTAGGGVEWMFMPNWSAKAEYLYYNLGKVNTTAVTTAVASIGARSIYTSNASTNITGNIVRAGVNYHFSFGAPVVAKY